LRGDAQIGEDYRAGRFGAARHDEIGGRADVFVDAQFQPVAPG
jgi:hypothetical protein